MKKDNQTKKLACPKHNRILVGKDKCVECAKEAEVREWEKRFDKEFPVLHDGFDGKPRNDIKAFISDLLAKEKMELVEEVVEFVNQNQDCGACNLDIEIKKYLEALKSEEVGG